MGAVGVWCMHFIGNNSLTLTYDNASYQLDYKAGYTFASLVVSIACMFISFCFVGVTEKVYLYRIIPSGLFTGLGVVCMHYLGQFAINYFIIVYKKSFVIGAIVIACVAVTAALYIFFKLRENWMNTWYKRLGCAMLMALAVCGMHYTALLGTIFYLPPLGTPPRPTLSTGALIGIIAAIVVVACVTLISIRFKTIQYRKTTHKRLILDCLLFDPSGLILVQVDGTLPMKEIHNDLENNELTRGFCLNHPLFIRLFEKTIRNTSPITPIHPNFDTDSLFSNIEQKYTEALEDLQQELGFEEPLDLGILSDIVITTGTQYKQSLFKKKRPFLKNPNETVESFPEAKEKRLSRLSLWGHRKTDEECGPGLSIEDSDGQDTHLFLTRQLTNDQDVKRFMSQGYRFAQANFISKTMGDRLRIPAETMHQCFLDMHQLTRFKLNQEESPVVCMGVFMLTRDSQVLVNRDYGIPLVEMNVHVGQAELEFINTTLQGCLLEDLAEASQASLNPKLSRALEQAANQLMLQQPGLERSVLQSTLLDLPAFSLTGSPCQLVLFSTISVPVADSKYIPLAIYRPLWIHLTDQEATRYQRQHPARPYSMQQQIYQQAGLSDSVLSEDEDQFSLPPPPRSRRKRQTITQSLHLPSLHTILPSKDRFWWIEIIVENTIHNT
ncbi:unnamed protein product [Rhizopus stolonifer]